ncbi:MAG: sirohydrochlorin chelatase, partial [Fischerella sp.]|nr:sirohydrochlorin chelatase [Fischerella sp.]
IGQVQMNCEMCKFRLAAGSNHHGHDHSHHHHHDHHSHNHSHPPVDPYADIEQYHQKIWQAP